MSRQLIGYENLPNAFIKKIEIVGYDRTKNILNFSVCVHDLAEGSVWSDSEEIFNQMMRVGFIISTSSEETQQIINGEMSPLKSEMLHTKNIGKHSLIEDSKMYESKISCCVLFELKRASIHFSAKYFYTHAQKLLFQ